jgi:hypothetical protein
MEPPNSLFVVVGVNTVATVAISFNLVCFDLYSKKSLQVLDQPNRAVIMVPNLKWR